VAEHAAAQPVQYRRVLIADPLSKIHPQPMLTYD
jgi:hypothetical protein